MAPKHLTEDGTQKTTFQELECSLSLVGEVQQQPIYYAIFNIVLSITAFLGNSIILVALHKESSLHPPSKLLYRCLAVTDLLVGLVSQPCHVSYWMSLVQEHWSLCPYARDAAYITSYALCGVSVYDDGHKRGQTSRSVIGAEIQTKSNFEAHICHYSYLLDCM